MSASGSSSASAATCSFARSNSGSQKGVPLKLKPIRLRCERLRVGSWTTTQLPEDKNSFEAKFLFSRKKFVWEWRTDSNGNKLKIEVPFPIIESMYGEQLSSNLFKFSLRMNAASNMFQGKQTPGNQPKWSVTTDFTGGSIASSMLHELELSIDGVAYNGLLEKIAQYSPEFQAMIKRGRGGDGAEKRLGGVSAAVPLFSRQKTIGGVNPIVSKVLGSDRFFPSGSSEEDILSRKRRRDDSVMSAVSDISAEATSGVETNTSIPLDKKRRLLSLSKFCSCSGGCRPGACSCIASLEPCKPDVCGCPTQCSSPLNELKREGVDALRGNQCFADNSDDEAVWKLLQSIVTLPCCSSQFQLLEAVASGFSCRCGTLWSYSFCLRRFVAPVRCTDGSVSRPFHCVICRRCQGGDARHCQGCARCVSPSSPCICRNASSREPAHHHLAAVSAKPTFTMVPPAESPTRDRNDDPESEGDNSLSPCSQLISPATASPFEIGASAAGVSCIELGKDIQMAKRISLMGEGSSVSPGELLADTPDSLSSLASPSDATDSSSDGPSLCDLSPFALACLGLSQPPRFVELDALNIESISWT